MTKDGYEGFYLCPANEQTKECMKYGQRDDIIYYLYEYECEVIGNVHDNRRIC